MTRIVHLALCVGVLGIGTLPRLASAEPVRPGMKLSGMAVLLASSTKQGGQGTEGTSILTHLDMQYNWSRVGFGMYFQYDKLGTSEVDTGLGPKLEFTGGPFYLELGYTFLVQRAFKDRSIANQTGTGSLIGLGIRFHLFKMGNRDVLFQAAYKYRTQTLTKQDGVAISEPITQIDGYPVGGLGISF